MENELKNYLLKILLPMLIVVPASVATASDDIRESADLLAIKNEITARYGTASPREWGEKVSGVKTRLKTREKVVALTFDACGSSKGMGYDARLIEFLRKENVPATLFINGRWIPANRASFDMLASDPLFEIANHGFRHSPASVNGRSAYGINGTKNIPELVEEIELNALRIQELTGSKPRFYRSGTAYYDEIAVKVAEALGEQVAGFSVLGDAGATFTREQVAKAILSASPGALIILHMNHPESGTAAGVMDAIPVLKKKGYRFVRLSEMDME